MRVVFEPANATATVAAFQDPVEAELARGALQGEGIAAELRDSALVGIAAHLSNAVGGVKLVVAQADAARAEAVLLRIRALADLGPHDEGDAEPATSRADDLALRAFRASIFGLFTVPVLFHLWSLWLLVASARAGGPVSSQARWRSRAALATDLLILGTVAAMVRIRFY